jgi:hypothetical protein
LGRDIVKGRNGRFALAGEKSQGLAAVNWLSKLERRACDPATGLRGNILLICISGLHDLVALALCWKPRKATRWEIKSGGLRGRRGAVL